MARNVSYYELSEKTLSGKERIVGIFRAREISEKIGCSVKTVSEYAYNGCHYKGRWGMERVDVANLAEEWDKARMKILNKGQEKQKKTE
ncbi:MAG: hypothetical protein Q4F24_07995, partial [Eubacteriales bacterium]|nr:hypothetical protein [Eubacteriales bacterium]